MTIQGSYTAILSPSQIHDNDLAGVARLSRPFQPLPRRDGPSSAGKDPSDGEVEVVRGAMGVAAVTDEADDVTDAGPAGGGSRGAFSMHLTRRSPRAAAQVGAGDYRRRAAG